MGALLCHGVEENLGTKPLADESPEWVGESNDDGIDGTGSNFVFELLQCHSVRNSRPVHASATYTFFSSV